MGQRQPERSIQGSKTMFPDSTTPWITAHQYVSASNDANMKRLNLDVLVIGGANTDFLIRGNKLPQPGETATGESFFLGAGGKGANQAVAAARLGARVALVGRVGKDARGEALLNSLKRERVETTFITCDATAPTG